MCSSGLQGSCHQQLKGGRSGTFNLLATLDDNSGNHPSRLNPWGPWECILNVRPFYISHWVIMLFKKAAGLTDRWMDNLTQSPLQSCCWHAWQNTPTASVSTLPETTQLYTSVDLLRTNSSCAQTTDHGLSTSCYYSVTVLWITNETFRCSPIYWLSRGDVWVYKMLNKPQWPLSCITGKPTYKGDNFLTDNGSSELKSAQTNKKKKQRSKNQWGLKKTIRNPFSR